MFPEEGLLIRLLLRTHDCKVNRFFSLTDFLLSLGPLHTTFSVCCSYSIQSPVPILDPHRGKSKCVCVCVCAKNFILKQPQAMS